MTCELCDVAAGLPRARRTTWHHEDDTCVVLDCETCAAAEARDRVMIVFRNHREPTSVEVEYVERVAARMGLRITRRVPRKIKDHPHYHAEREDDR